MSEKNTNQTPVETPVETTIEDTVEKLEAEDVELIVNTQKTLAAAQKDLELANAKVRAANAERELLLMRVFNKYNMTFGVDTIAGDGTIVRVNK